MRDALRDDVEQLQQRVAGLADELERVQVELRRVRAEADAEHAAGVAAVSTETPQRPAVEKPAAAPTPAARPAPRPEPTLPPAGAAAPRREARPVPRVAPAGTPPQPVPSKPHAAAAPSERATLPAERPTAPAPPPKPPRPTTREVLERYDLLGARGLAIVGGLVTLLGVTFLFVLAANRGWIGPAARVAAGALVSAALVMVGAWVKRRYGRLDAAVASVSTGIAAAFATLAAATMIYEMLPPAGALLAAAGIAAIACVLAVRWRAELVGVLGLVGLVTAPALLAVEEGIEPVGTAFALLGFAGSVAVACWMRWRWLLIATAISAGAQSVGLTLGGAEGDRSAIAVVSLAAAVFVAAAIAWQLTRAGEAQPFPAFEHERPRADVFDPVALGLTGVAILLLLTGSRLFEWAVDAATWRMVGALAATLVATALAWPVRRLASVLAFAAIALAATSAAAWVDAAVVSDSAARLAAVATGLAFVGCALAWQWRFHGEGLDPVGGSLALAATAAALAGSYAIVADDRARGLVLLCAALVGVVAAVVARRRSVDLAHVVAGGVLVLVAVATADLVGGRDLTLVWAIQAAGLALAANRIGSVRLEVAALGYLALALVRLWAADLPGTATVDARLEAATTQLFVVAAASLAVGLLLPTVRRDRPAEGILAPLDRLLGALHRSRLTVREFAAILAFALAALGTAGLTSGRTLAIVWSIEAAALALTGRWAGEPRLVPFALASLLLGSATALALDPASTILEPDGFAFLDPIPSLAAAAAAVLVVALAGEPRGTGLRVLGPVAGVEQPFVDLLGMVWPQLRRALVIAGGAIAVIAVSLALIASSYAAGQVAVTALWAYGAVLLTVLAARRAMLVEVCAAWVLVGLAVAKATSFDAVELSGSAGGWSLVLVAAPVVAIGFATRWLITPTDEPLEVLSAATGVVGVGLAAWGLEDLVGDGRALGVALLPAVLALSGLAAVSFRRDRAGDTLRPWLRAATTVYWVLAVLTLLGCEILIARSVPASLTLFAATAIGLTLACAALREPRLGVAAVALLLLSTVVVLLATVPPSRFITASEHPGADLWALVAVVVAWLVVAELPPPLPLVTRLHVALLTGGLALYALSLGILEIAERLSTASVETDFQRGHTAVSAVWAVIALLLVAIALIRGSTALRWTGLALFGLALAKLFLYDLRSLSSVTRALSFLVVGMLLLAAAFAVQHLAQRDRRPPGPRAPGPHGGVPA